MACPCPLQGITVMCQQVLESPSLLLHDDALTDAANEILDLEDVDLQSSFDKSELPEWDQYPTETKLDAFYMHESNVSGSPLHEDYIDVNAADSYCINCHTGDFDVVVNTLIQSDLLQMGEDKEPILLTSLHQDKTRLRLCSSKPPTPIPNESVPTCDPTTPTREPVVVRPQTSPIAATSTRHVNQDVRQALSPMETLSKPQHIKSCGSLPTSAAFVPLSPSSSLSSSPIPSRPSSPDSLSLVLSQPPSPSSSPMPPMANSIESDSWSAPIINSWSTKALSIGLTSEETDVVDNAVKDDSRRDQDAPSLVEDACQDSCRYPKRRPLSEQATAKKKMRPANSCKSRTVPQGDCVVHAVGEYDVVFGRGGKSIHHVGNVRFRDMIMKHLEEYRDSNKTEKTAIARSVVREITQTLGGRFLMKNGDNSWTVVPFQRARIKASQRFREALSKRGWGQGCASLSSSSSSSGYYSSPSALTQVEDEETDEIIAISD